MPPREVNQPYFHSTYSGVDPGPSPEAERVAGAGERRGSTENLSEHEQRMRSLENRAGAQDLARKEENPCAAQDCPGLAGTAGRSGGHGALGRGMGLRTGGSTGEGTASHSAAFPQCNQTEPCVEVCIKRLQGFKKRRTKKVKATPASSPGEAGRSAAPHQHPCLPQLPKAVLCPRQNPQQPREA